jgi:hypothetical protein
MLQSFGSQVLHPTEHLATPEVTLSMQYPGFGVPQVLGTIHPLQFSKHTATHLLLAAIEYPEAHPLQLQQSFGSQVLHPSQHLVAPEVALSIQYPELGVPQVLGTRHPLQLGKQIGLIPLHPDLLLMQATLEEQVSQQDGQVLQLLSAESR